MYTIAKGQNFACIAGYIYIYILSKIIAFPLLHLVIDVLLGTSYCGINIRSMLDHVDLRLFYLNGKIIIYYLSTIYVFVYIYSRVGGILERIQYMGACLIALKVFFHPCNNPRFARIVTQVKENLEGNSASSHVYIIQLVLMMLVLRHLVALN